MKRLICYLLIVCLSFSLFACSSNNEINTQTSASETTEVPTSESETQEQLTEQTSTALLSPTVYKVSELGFQLTFPAHWEGRFDVERAENVAEYTVSADSNAVFTITAVANAPGAYESSLELIADGYEFFNENFEYSYFIKLLGNFPEDLSWNSTGIVGQDPVAYYDALMLFSYEGEEMGEMITTQYGKLIRSYYGSILLPEPDAQTYYNYRLGICLDLPEHLSGKFITPLASTLVISNYKESVFEWDTDLVEIGLYDYDKERNGTTYDPQNDPYLITNQERGYEAYIPIAEKDSRIYYFYSVTSNELGLNASRQQIYNALSDIFAITE